MNKICFFNTIVFWGGGEKLHLETALEFKKLGHEIIICSNSKAPLYNKSKSHDLDVFSLKVLNLSFLNPFKLFKCIRFFKNNNIGTVIFSSSQDSKLAGIAARFAGLKNIVYLRGLAAPIKSNIVNRYLFKFCFTHIVANSEETKRMILKNLSSVISKDKLYTIYHGIDVSKIKSSNDTKLKEVTENSKGIILGNAGRLTAQKGQKYLIDIAKKLKNKNLEFTLFIAGTGDMESELKQLIIENGLNEEIIMLGFIDDMNAFMNSIDIFLLTSEWEGFGFVLVEAMARKVPVVCFDISSNPEIIKDKETGFLAPFPDTSKFAKHVLTLANDYSLIQKMGEASKKRVFNNFIIEDRIKELDETIIK
tara:strand:+ start:550 stop:1641 length:1092 start_codon:yes stop_codon:yes gene_type:complete